MERSAVDGGSGHTYTGAHRRSWSYAKVHRTCPLARAYLFKVHYFVPRTSASRGRRHRELLRHHNTWRGLRYSKLLRHRNRRCERGAQAVLCAREVERGRHLGYRAAAAFPPPARPTPPSSRRALAHARVRCIRTAADRAVGVVGAGILPPIACPRLLAAASPRHPPLRPDPLAVESAAFLWQRRQQPSVLGACLGGWWEGGPVGVWEGGEGVLASGKGEGAVWPSWDDDDARRRALSLALELPRGGRADGRTGGGGGGAGIYGSSSFGVRVVV